MLNKNLKSEIYWSVLILMLLGTLVVGTQLFFVITMVYFAWIVFKHKGKVFMPAIGGLKMYIIFIIYSTLFGLLLYPFRYVIRDLYYVLPTLFWILIGFSMHKGKETGQKDIFKTLYLYGGIVALRSIAAFLLNPTWDFDEIRLFFGVGVYDVGFVLPILVVEVLLLKKTIFSKLLDRSLIVLMTVQIALSFGRIAILQPIIELIVLVVLLGKYKTEHKKLAIRTIGLTGIIIALVVIVINVLPSTEMDILMDKFDYVFSEIDSNQMISSTKDAMKNWRGYEIQAVQKQWTENNLIYQLFGEGMGKGIHVDYTPANWENIVVENEIPLLHNGFYTLLPKGGIFAVLALLLINLSCIRKGFIHSKENTIYGIEGFVLIAVIVAGLANTYVVRGPIQQGAFLVWGILIGYLSREKTVNEKEIPDGLSETTFD